MKKKHQHIYENERTFTSNFLAASLLSASIAGQLFDSSYKLLTHSLAPVNTVATVKQYLISTQQQNITEEFTE